MTTTIVDNRPEYPPEWDEPTFEDIAPEHCPYCHEDVLHDSGDEHFDHTLGLGQEITVSIRDNDFTGIFDAWGQEICTYTTVHLTEGAIDYCYNTNTMDLGSDENINQEFVYCYNKKCPHLIQHQECWLELAQTTWDRFHEEYLEGE